MPTEWRLPIVRYYLYSIWLYFKKFCVLFCYNQIKANIFNIDCQSKNMYFILQDYNTKCLLYFILLWVHACMDNENDCRWKLECQCHLKQNWKCGFSQGEDNCLSEQKMRCTDLIMYVLSMFLQNSFAGVKLTRCYYHPSWGSSLQVRCLCRKC